MSPPARWLVVCLGNTCRSPMAERLLQARLGPAYDVRSAGVRAAVGAPMPAEAVAALEEIAGADATDRPGPDPTASGAHRAHQLAEEDLAAADLVLTMTEEIRDLLRAQVPGHAGRILTLREHAGLPDLDVPDPVGLGPEAYAAAAQAIDEAVRRVAVGVAGG